MRSRGIAGGIPRNFSVRRQQGEIFAPDAARYWENILHKVNAILDAPPEWEAEHMLAPPGREKTAQPGIATLQDLPPSTRQLTSFHAGIFVSNVTKVNRAAWVNAQRYASVQRFGDVNWLCVKNSHTSGSSFGSAM